MRTATLFIAAMIVGPSGARADGTQAPAGRIVGRVVMASDPQSAVRGVLVTLIPQSAQRPDVHWSTLALGDLRATYTDGSGSFELREVPAGRYRVTARKPAFLPTEFGATGSAGPGTAVAVDPGTTVTLQIAMIRGSVIAGRVRQPNGTPAVGLAVSVMAPEGPGPGRAFVWTDDRGAFRIFGLLPGDYLVVARPLSTLEPVSSDDVDTVLAALEARFRKPGVSPYRSPAAPVAPNARSDAGMPAGIPATPARVFYPGTTVERDAIRVTLGPGEVRTGIDFPVVLAGTVQVSGVVTLPDGRPAAGATVVLATTQRATTDATGAFLLVGVPPGRHTVTATASGPAALASLAAVGDDAPRGAGVPKVALWSRTDVNVGPLDVRGLTLSLQPGMVLTGRVEFIGDARTAPADLRSVQITLALNGRVISSTNASADGTFSLGGIVPGQVEISAQVAGDNRDWRLTSAMRDGQDLLDLPLTFDGTKGIVEGVILRFTDRRTTLSGRLYTVDGSPATSLFVAAVTTERRYWHGKSRRVAFTRPGSDGLFEFTDLPAGEYVLLALRSVDPATWPEPALLESALGSGVKVMVEPGAQVFQELRVK